MMPAAVCSAMRDPRGPQQRLMLAQGSRIGIPYLLEKLGAAFNVGEKKGHRAGGQQCQGRPPVMVMTET
jgi:hypothetical protein